MGCVCLFAVSMHYFRRTKKPQLGISAVVNVVDIQPKVATHCLVCFSSSCCIRKRRPIAKARKPRRWRRSLRLLRVLTRVHTSMARARCVSVRAWNKKGRRARRAHRPAPPRPYQVRDVHSNTHHSRAHTHTRMHSRAHLQTPMHLRAHAHTLPHIRERWHALYTSSHVLL